MLIRSTLTLVLPVSFNMGHLSGAFLMHFMKLLLGTSPNRRDHPNGKRKEEGLTMSNCVSPDELVGI
jgi:hypothetical protein